MKTEKVYIVISHYAMRDNNISMTIYSTLGDALADAENELKTTYTTSVEIYEANSAQYSFFGRQVFKYKK